MRKNKIFVLNIGLNVQENPQILPEKWAHFTGKITRFSR